MEAINERMQDEAVELLETLIGIKSVNPPGNEDRIADAVEVILARADLETTRVPLEDGRSSVVARLKGRKPGSLVMCGHLDTVNTDPGEWFSDPWIAKRDGSRLYGLGSADMKSGVAVLIAVILEPQG